MLQNLSKNKLKQLLQRGTSKSCAHQSLYSKHGYKFALSSEFVARNDLLSTLRIRNLLSIKLFSRCFASWEGELRESTRGAEMLVYGVLRLTTRAIDESSNIFSARRY